MKDLCKTCSLKSEDESTKIMLAQMKREVEKLSKDTNARLLMQDGKLAETCVYIKNNLSNYLRELVDAMTATGEINNIIGEILTELNPIVDRLNKDNAVFTLHSPSLMNATQSQSITLVMNDEHAILFDTGTPEHAPANISWLREKLGNRKLDVVFISHYHYDHMGGLSSFKGVMSNYTKVYLPLDMAGYMNSTDDPEELTTIRNGVLSWLRSNGIRYEEINTDKVFNFGELCIKVYNSNPDAYNYYKATQSRYNAYSTNYLLVLGETKVLLPADSTKVTQDYLLGKGQVEKVTVFASNHHGYERYSNTEYLNRLNPEIEYFSASPLDWDDVTMLSYDFNIKNKARTYLSETFAPIDIELTTHSATVINGYHCVGNMFINKVYDLYINPNYLGVSDGTQAKPFRTINQALTSIDKEGCNVSLHFASGVYEKLRFISTSNLYQIYADDNDVVFKDCQINNANTLYFNGIKFIGNIVCNYGYAFFSECVFECESTASGNMCITINRANVSFGNCSFSNCYTGIYAQSGCQVSVRTCAFDCNAYAIYGINSYIGLNDYTLTNGTLRADIGCMIKTVDKGASDKRPVFNNSDYMRGYAFFDTRLGKMIFYYNGDGADAWIDAMGNIV